MSQPSGPYGPGPYGPGPYGAPGQPPYGQQPPPYGPPAYGAPGPYSPPPPPRNKNLLPWLIVGGAVVLSGLGILLVVLLRGDDSPDPQIDATNSTAPVTSSFSADASASHADLPGGAQVAEEQNSADQSRYEGSADTALAWVQAMAKGEFQTAYDLSCAEVQTAATQAEPGADPAWSLGTYFFEQTLGGQGFSDGTFDSIIYSGAADSDVASFTLQTDDGQEFLLLVYVQPDGTVCDFL